MIKITNTCISGFESAVRGMRMPFMSHQKTDSFYKENEFMFGKNDMDLACSLIKGGSEHRKFLRYINVSCTITAPVFFDAELDTYKIGTVRNSSSLMHLGSKRDFTRDDFSCEDMYDSDIDIILDIINRYRRLYAKNKNMQDFRALRESIPMGFNYTFEFACNYEVLLNIYKQRKHHRLKEWHYLCEWIETLTYMNKFINAMEGDLDDSTV